MSKVQMNLNSACVLQVEDDEHDVYFLKYAFDRAGISNPVQVAADGEQAVSYLSGTGRYADRAEYPLPNLVLLDLKLPRRSGLEVLKWLRDQAPLKAIVVVVFTSSSDPRDLQRSYELGANSFVIKPADLEQRVEFAKVLKSWWLGCNQFAPLSETPSTMSSCHRDRKTQFAIDSG